MSIPRLALRLATVKALTGRTFAEDRVVDSSVETLAEAIRPEPTPVLMVFTDEATGEVEGRDLLAGAGRATLAIEIVVTHAVRAETGETTIMIPATDAGLEMSLDLIERQVRVALTDPRSAWAEMWRRLAFKVDSMRVLRGAGSRKGTRFAARRIEIVTDTLSDPVPGQPVEELWAEFLAMIEQDTGANGLSGIAAELRAQIEGTALPSWQRAQAALGLTSAGIGGTGLAPLLDHTTGEPARLEAGVLDPLGIAVEDGEDTDWDIGSGEDAT